MDKEDDFSKDILLTVAQFCAKHSWPPHGGLRHLIFKRKENGLDSALMWCGKKVLINERKWFQWMNERNEKARQEQLERASRKEKTTSSLT